MNIPSVLAIIPARYASSRYPGKPLAVVAGRSMIAHVYEQASRARLVGRVAVATDDARIADHVRAFGGEAVMTSPDHASGTDRVAEAATLLGGADIVINVQGDEPMLDPSLLDDLVTALQTSDAGCATPVRPIHTLADLLAPSVVKVALTADARPLYFSRSPIPYLRDHAQEEWIERGQYRAHVGIYAYRSAALERFVAAPPSLLELSEQLEQLRLFELGIEIRCVESAYSGHAIDTPEDVAIVEGLMLAARMHGG